jgi:hypothetical protein
MILINLKQSFKLKNIAITIKIDNNNRIKSNKRNDHFEWFKNLW